MRKIGVLAKELGKRALVVTGRDKGRAEALLGLLREQGIETVIFATAGEPQIGTVEKGRALARQEHCDLVIGFGGGSPLDAAKAIAAMLTNTGGLLEYLEVIGMGKALSQPSAPFIAIPTTAGTGSEVTRNAVLGSTEHRVKVSLRSPFMLPKIALVDPELTHDLPPALTASTGMDALTQLIEPYVSTRANPMADLLCCRISGVAISLRVAVETGNHGARRQMALASLSGGMALANAGLGVVHALAGPIGGMFPAPHGALCGALLAPAMEANLGALRARQPSSEALQRYDEIAQFLTGDHDAGADAGAAWVDELVANLQIPRLRSYGINREHIADLVEKAGKANSMKTNPIPLTAGELTRIVEMAL